MTRVREIDIKCRTYYFFLGMINIKYCGPNNIKIDEKVYKNIFIRYIGDVAPNSIKPLYLIINKMSGYIEKHKDSNYLTLVHTDESRYILKKV